MALPLLGALRFDLLTRFSKLASLIYVRCILLSCQIPEENHRDVYLELPSTKEWRPSEADDIERFEQNVTHFLILLLISLLLLLLLFYVHCIVSTAFDTVNYCGMSLFKLPVFSLSV